MCNTSQYVCVENTKGKLGGSVTEHMLAHICIWTVQYLDSAEHMLSTCVS